MAIAMRAKMVIKEVTRDGYQERLKLSAVCSGNKEDNSFSEATPCANLEIHISNKALHGKFNPGENYYVDFTPVAFQATGG